MLRGAILVSLLLFGSSSWAAPQPMAEFQVGSSDGISGFGPVVPVFAVEAGGGLRIRSFYLVVEAASQFAGASWCTNIADGPCLSLFVVHEGALELGVLIQTPSLVTVNIGAKATVGVWDSMIYQKPPDFTWSAGPTFGFAISRPGHPSLKIEFTPRIRAIRGYGPDNVFWFESQVLIGVAAPPLSRL